jgi:cytochrome c5
MNHRTYLLLAGASIILGIAGCSTPEPEKKVAIVPTEQAPGVRITRLWSQSCALCHVTGEAGAPRLGHAEEWAPRLASGKPLLLKHTIEGYNNMPPLGYCMACSEQDFSSLIDFMAAGESR